MTKKQKRSHRLQSSIYDKTSNGNDKQTGNVKLMSSNTEGEEWYWDESHGVWVVQKTHLRDVERRKEPENANASEYNAEESDSQAGNKQNETWSWNEEYATWVYHQAKRVRKKNLTNRMSKNWLLAMRRIWNTKKKDEILQKLTIKRSEMDTVCYFSEYQKTKCHDM